MRLAAEGHNNPEIGARLFMSHSTVKTHLSHVYAKLGVANRTGLAASRSATSRTGPEHRMLAAMPEPARHAPRIPAATAAPARSIIAITP